MNYRSHGGIVDCAGLVIDLITYFWPYSIDTLDREHGVVGGIKPMFISEWDDEAVWRDHLLHGEEYVAPTRLNIHN